jgi:hypothetical protein
MYRINDEYKHSDLDALLEAEVLSVSQQLLQIGLRPLESIESVADHPLHDQACSRWCAFRSG